MNDKLEEGGESVRPDWWPEWVASISLSKTGVIRVRGHAFEQLTLAKNVTRRIDLPRFFRELSLGSAQALDQYHQLEGKSYSLHCERVKVDFQAEGLATRNRLIPLMNRIDYAAKGIDFPGGSND